jgi:PAS domain S-box-containing protein
MRIRYKLILAFIIISLFVGLVGIIGIYANNRVVTSYEIGEEHFGSIIEASNEVSSYAKRAEGHMFLFLTLHNESDRKKLFQRITSLREQTAIMEGKVRNPDAIKIISDTKSKTDELQSIADSLFKLYDNEIKTTEEFDFKNHEELIRKLDDVSAAIRENGLELGKIEIDLQSKHNLQAKQEASSLYNLIFIISGIAILFVLIIVIIIDKNISNPINKLRDIAVKIGKGNLDMKIDIKSNDEIGELSNEFNGMVQKLKKSNEEIISSKEYTDNIIKSMKDSLIVVSQDGIIKRANNATILLLGFTEQEIIGQPINKIIPDGDKLLLNNMKCDIGKKRNPPGEETSFISKGQKKIDIIFSASIMYDKYGNIQDIVCVAQDITERKRSEKIVEDSLHDKEVLLREIHHRVKNNMQIISSLLSHQMENINDNKIKDIFAQSQNRILSMALVHEKLYQSSDLRNIDFKEYINDLAANLFESYRKSENIKININVKDILLDIDLAIPTGLIINELITNSLKYAFPGSMKGEINISFRSTGENLFELVIGDNGIGFPKDLDFRKTKSLGLHLVTILAEKQLHGSIDINRNKGTEFQIKFYGIKS